MILGSGKLALSSAYILAGLTQCPAAPAPEVTLDFRNNAPRYVSDLSSAELGRFKIDTVFSHGPNEVFTVGGLTESNIKSGFTIDFRTMTWPSSGAGCVWVHKLNLEVHYSPLVRIAREFPPRSCRYGVTAQHELRHVNTDVITLKEYLPRLKKGANDIVKSLGSLNAAGKKDFEKAQSLFVSAVRTEMERQSAEMERVRALRQQQIDTRQEYLRLGNACPKEKR